MRVFVCEQAREDEDRCGGRRRHAKDRDSDQLEEKADGKCSAEFAAYHLADRQASVGRAVRRQDLRGDEHQMNGCGDGHQRRKRRLSHDDQRGGAGDEAYDQVLWREQRTLPEIARLRLGEEKCGVRSGGDRERNPDERECRRRPEYVHCDQQGKCDEDQAAANQPAPPLRAREDQVETLGVLEIADEKREREGEENCGQQRRRPSPEHARAVESPENDECRGDEIRAGRDRFGPHVEADRPAPRCLMRHIVGEHRRRDVVRLRRMA